MINILRALSILMKSRRDRHRRTYTIRGTNEMIKMANRDYLVIYKIPSHKSHR